MILFYVGQGIRARKYYATIFMCLVTRAVHLEYVEDASTDAFLSAFRRFVSRLSELSDMYSDNGTNFRGADRELRQAFLAVCQNHSLHHSLSDDRTS